MFNDCYQKRGWHVQGRVFAARQEEIAALGALPA